MADQPATKPSLLLRIRDSRDRVSWSQFVEIYAPLIYSYLRHQGLQDADAADLTQDVLQSVAAAIAGFDYRAAGGGFRRWLFTVVRNRLRNFWRSQQRQPVGAGGDEGRDMIDKQAVEDVEVGDAWDQEYERHLFQCAADQVRGDFECRTWQAFWRTTVEGRPPKTVATELQMSVAAVYLARGRVLQRIKEQLQLLNGEC